MNKLALLISLVISALVAGVLSASARTVLEGTWQGTYTCGGRVIPVKIMMEPFQYYHSGVFRFMADNGREASFNFIAYMSSKGVFETEPGMWIGEPRRSGAVALNGKISPNKRSIKGSVIASGCSSFEIDKIH